MEKSSLLKTGLFLLCLPMLFASCDKEQAEYEQKSGGPIEFIAAVDAVTRSTIGWADFKCAFEAGDAIGIYAAPHGTALSASGNYAQNVKLVRQPDGKWSYANPAQAIFFPAEGVTLDIYAYYPYTDTQASPAALPFSAGPDQSAGASGCELLWVSVSDVAEAGNEISLQFGHLLAMIQLEVSAAADSAIQLADITAMDVKLNGLKSAVTFNAGDGTATLAGETCRINMERQSGAFVFRALVPVQDITPGAILFSCTVEHQSKFTQFNYEAAPGTVLESGVVRLYNVKLP